MAGSFWGGLILGFGAAAAACELPFVNWASLVPPVDARPLLIRQDAKGDGRFSSPRSGRRRHRGIDLAAEVNSPVRAIRSGRVVQVGTHRGLGRFVELEHRHGLNSLYAHLNEIAVEPGERVRQGEPIGTVGKTGNARHPWITPHVHLEVLKDGEPIDPQLLGLQAVEASVARADSSPESSDAAGGE